MKLIVSIITFLVSMLTLSAQVTIYPDTHGALPSEYSSDGTHPNQTAYTIMEGIILPILQSYSAQ